MRVNYPILGVASTDKLLFLSGGGGSARTGIQNAVDVYGLHTDENEKLFHKTMSIDTSIHLASGISVSPDGTLMALSVNMSCWVFEIGQKHKSLKLLIKFRTDFAQHDTEQSCVTFVGNFTLITGGQDSVVRVWKLYRNAERTNALPDAKPLICPLGADANQQYTPDAVPVVGNQLTNEGTTVMLSYEYRGHGNRIRQIDVDTFSRNLVATSSQDQTCHLWRLSDMQRVHRFEMKDIPIELAPKSQYRCLRFADAGQTLYTVLSPPRGASIVVRWKPRDRYQKLEHDWPWDCVSAKTSVHSSPIGSLAISPDSRLVAIGSAGGEVSILSTDNNTFELHKSCTPHDFAVTGLVFIEKSQEQHVLISTGADKIVMGHNVPIEQPKAGSGTLTTFFRSFFRLIIACVFTCTLSIAMTLLLLGAVKLGSLESVGITSSSVATGLNDVLPIVLTAIAIVSGTYLLFFSNTSIGVRSTLTYGLKYNGFAYAILVLVSILVKRSDPDDTNANISVVLTGGLSLLFFMAHATMS